MYMKQISECQMILDEADPFFLEMVGTLSDQELGDVMERLNKEQDIARRLNKSLTDINKRINAVAAIQHMRIYSTLLVEAGEAPLRGEYIIP